MQQISPRAIQLFLLLLFALSAPLYVAIARLGMQPLVLTAIMCAPAVSALATALICKISLRGFGWRWPSARYALASYLIPFAYITAGYVSVWALHGGGFYNPAFVAKAAAMFGLHGRPPGLVIVVAFALVATLAVAIDALPVLGEEIGWRGFLAPALAQRFGFVATALISGGIWAIWHFPGIFWSGYNGGNGGWYDAACFTVLIVAISFPLTYLRLRSGSLWTGVIFHATHNALIQAFFTGITIKYATTRLFIDEFGIGLLPFAIAVAVWFVLRERQTREGSNFLHGAHAATP